MARRRNHVDSSIAEINLSQTVRPIREIVIAANAVDIETNHLNIRQVRELSIAGTMVAVSMGVDHKQRKFSAEASSGQQAHHGLRPAASALDRQRRPCGSEASFL